MQFLMEAHNGLSARIAEEAGFRGIWASSLTISAALGVRDNNEASWTQVIDIVEFMNDNVAIPLLLDGDTGYGNFNSVRRLVRKLEQKGIAGVCIEDKLFPKTNSFIGGEQQPLADIEEFCGRIKAGKDVQSDGNFSLIARTEAFIAGWGVEEALRRAHAYVEAGADAILVHSKLRHPQDLLEFLQKWQECSPVIIVPTAYYDFPLENFADKGVAVVVWANHLLRSSITAMQKTAGQIAAEKSIRNIEKKISPLAEIFRLQNMDEYREAEFRYLPQIQKTQAVILAASKGEDFGTLTRDIPKCLLQIEGKTLLETQVATMNDLGIKDISIVVGYKKRAINVPHLTYIYNKDYARGGIMASYLQGMAGVLGPCIVSFGDILYETHVLRDLLEQEGDIVLAVDVSWWQGYKQNREIDAVIAESPPAEGYLACRSFAIKRIGTGINHQDAHGEWIGLMKLSTRGTEIFKKELQTFFAEAKNSFSQADINDFLMRLISRKVAIRGYFFRGHWLDIDGPEDLLLPWSAKKASKAKSTNRKEKRR